jgi:hypothetical protein
MMATEKKAAATPTKRATAAAPAATGGMKFWVMQQGRTWYVESSAGFPDNATQEGERTKVVHASFGTQAEAEAFAKRRAGEAMGEFEG